MKGRYSQAISSAFIYGFKEVNNANEYNNAGHVADVFWIVGWWTQITVNKRKKIMRTNIVAMKKPKTVKQQQQPGCQ